MLWVDLVRRGFRRHSTYRAAAVAGIITNIVFGCVRAFVLLAIVRARPAIAGYSASGLVTFTFLTQGLIMVFGGFGLSLDLPERIKNGDIAIDLQRPVDFQGWWLAMDIGRAGWHVIARGIAPVVVGAVLFDVRLPPTPGAAAVFVLAVMLGVVVGFGLRYLVAVSCFWLLDERGVAGISTVIWTFFSGLYLPIPLFPGWLRSFAMVSPWAMTVQASADAWLGRVGVGTLFLQAGWAVALLLAGRALTRAARHKVVVQGG